MLFERNEGDHVSSSLNKSYEWKKTKKSGKNIGKKWMAKIGFFHKHAILWGEKMMVNDNKKNMIWGKINFKWGTNWRKKLSKIEKLTQSSTKNEWVEEGER